MDITSAQYIVDLDGSTNVSVKATIDGKQMVVPLVTDNRHFQAIQEWVAKGNTIQPAE